MMAHLVSTYLNLDLKTIVRKVLKFGNLLDTQHILEADK